VIVKDDLYIAAFFWASVAACRHQILKDSLGPWRVGVALGLLLACKSTALLTIPVLFLVIDAPFRAGWSKLSLLTMATVSFLLAGPWYLRTLLLTGNLFYPLEIKLGNHVIMPGLFTLARDIRQNHPLEIIHFFTQGYFQLPLGLAAIIALTWIAAMIFLFKRARRESILRLALLGFPVGLASYMLASPILDSRYFIPLFLPPLLSCAAGLALRLFSKLRYVLGVAFLIVAVATSSPDIYSPALFWFSAAGLGAAVVGLGFQWIKQTRRFKMSLEHSLAIWATFAATIGICIYIKWSALIVGRNTVAIIEWDDKYGKLAYAWDFVRDPQKVSPDATIAYANTFLIYPLFGPNFQHHVVYAPVRPSLHNVRDFPFLGDRIDGGEIVPIVSRAMNTGADRDVWLANLRASQAQFLFVAKDQVLPNPPELEFAGSEPGKLRKVFENSAAVIFEIRD
jgi:hypothetical protein